MADMLRRSMTGFADQPRSAFGARSTGAALLSLLVAAGMVALPVSAAGVDVLLGSGAGVGTGAGIGVGVCVAVESVAAGACVAPPVVWA
ncbi:MAG: hypothetical protein ABI887_06380 [Burkholderiales bacterium]